MLIPKTIPLMVEEESQIFIKAIITLISDIKSKVSVIALSISYLIYLECFLDNLLKYFSVFFFIKHPQNGKSASVRDVGSNSGTLSLTACSSGDTEFLAVAINVVLSTTTSVTYLLVPSGAS